MSYLFTNYLTYSKKFIYYVLYLLRSEKFMKKPQVHSDLINSYVSVLGDVVFIINKNLGIITDTPSVDLKKYYLTEINMLHFGKVGDEVTYLSKIHELKKYLNIINKIASNLLKDVITYCNRYGLDETEFFEKINEISNIGNINRKAINYSITTQLNTVPENVDFNELIRQCEGLMETYYKVLTKFRQNIDSKNYKFPLIVKNNIYKNLQLIGTNIDHKKILKINDFVLKNNKNAIIH